jgi:hypothetical protein
VCSLGLSDSLPLSQGIADWLELLFASLEQPRRRAVISRRGRVRKRAERSACSRGIHNTHTGATHSTGLYCIAPSQPCRKSVAVVWGVRFEVRSEGESDVSALSGCVKTHTALVLPFVRTSGPFAHIHTGGRCCVCQRHFQLPAAVYERQTSHFLNKRQEW